MEINLALIQMSCEHEVTNNIDKALSMVNEAADAGANIVCLQELYASRYFPRTVDARNYELARPLTDRTVEVMREKAADRKIVLIVPVFEYAKPGIYFNTAVVVDNDGTIVGKFRKHHIPEGPGYLEKYYFTPGNLGYPVFKTAYARIGVALCWDEWFPEVSRILGLKGAEIIFYPSAIGSEPDDPDFSSHDAWETVIRSHGITNSLFIAAVNRVGLEEDITFYGGSFISNPRGEILVKGDSEIDQIVASGIDLNEIKTFRNRFQFFRDRRPETYEELLKMLLE